MVKQRTAAWVISITAAFLYTTNISCCWTRLSLNSSELYLLWGHTPAVSSNIAMPEYVAEAAPHPAGREIKNRCQRKFWIFWSIIIQPSGFSSHWIFKCSVSDPSCRETYNKGARWRRGALHINLKEFQMMQDEQLQARAEEMGNWDLWRDWWERLPLCR